MKDLVEQMGRDKEWNLGWNVTVHSEKDSGSRHWGRQVDDRFLFPGHCAV
ncbi:MAG: hypothetical protein IPG58_15670 [Acidobacteria bacterium]|nr:hypothetical protein [Acidobacteriota bacterium]